MLRYLQVGGFLTKEYLVTALAAQTNLSPTECTQFVDTLGAVVLEQVKRGELVTIPDLGVFELVGRKARTGRNPRTGKPIQIPAQTAIHFRPAASFKRAVNP